MCCAIAALLLALFPAWTGGREAAVRCLGNARHLAMAGVAVAAAMGGTALAAGSYPVQAQHICSVLTGF